MKKQTAVEYLIQYMMNNQYFVGNDLEDYLLLADVFEQAKAMEREQIEQAYKQGCWDEIEERMDSYSNELYKTYYNKTYKGGSNE